MKLDIKDKLKEIRHLEADIETIRAEIETVRGLKRTSTDGGRGAETTDLSNLIVKIDRLEQMLDANLEKLIASKTEIETAMTALNTTQACIIRLRYFQGLTWEAIAVQLNYSYRNIHRHHGQALNTLRAIIE